MVNVYNYDDPVDFLSDYFNSRSSIDPSFSIREFANIAGLKSSATIIDILKRKKNISAKMSKVFIENTNIDAAEKMYFQALIAKKNTKDTDNLAMYDLIMNELRPTNNDKNPSFRTSHLDLFSHWIYMAIFAMNDLQNFEMTAENIQSFLRDEIELELIEIALFKLFEHKILVKKEDGTIESQFFKVSTQTDKKHKSARQYIEMVCDLAKNAYDVPLDKREFNSFSFTIADENIPLAKEIIRKCNASLLNLSEKGEPNNLYQVNLMLFPLSKIEDRA